MSGPDHIFQAHHGSVDKVFFGMDGAVGDMGNGAIRIGKRGVLYYEEHWEGEEVCCGAKKTIGGGED